MNYKMLCTDLDGTLLSTKSNVSDFTVSEINRIKGHIKVILVSARMPKSMVYLQQRLGLLREPMICYNGAYILQGNQELASTEIRLDLVSGIFELAEPLGIHLGLYHKDEWYVPQESERVRKEILYTMATPVFLDTEPTITLWGQREIGAHKIMLMATKSSADKVFPQLQALYRSELNLYRSNDTLIEISPIGVSKLSAIEQLLGLGDSLEEVIAFGDNFNDMEMLHKVGLGIAVANAREEVKAIANHITLKNTEDGVAHFIKQHL
jgi:Cof subfamily protein (haloacid dehalogenase superfamily)